MQNYNLKFKIGLNLKKPSNRICVFGYSITWGANDIKLGGWVNRLRLFIDKASNKKTRLYNLGVSGDTSNDLLKRIKNELKSRNPKLVIFSIGNNDSAFLVNKNQQWVNLSKFKTNLKKLKIEAEKFTKNIVFTGLTLVDEERTTPILWDNNIYYYNKNIIIYNNEIKKFCEINKLLFIDMVDVLNVHDLEDGLHPNSKGHEKIFRNIKTLLVKRKLI